MLFQWNNPIGYAVAVSLECISITYVFYIIMTMTSIGVAFYLHEISLTKEIKCILRSIDKNSESKKNRRILYVQSVEFCELHADTKQLSRLIFFYSSLNANDEFSPTTRNQFIIYFRAALMFSDLFQPIFMIYFPRTIFTLCYAMLLVQLELVEYSTAAYKNAMNRRRGNTKLYFQKLILVASCRLRFGTINIGLRCLLFNGYNFHYL